MDFGYLHEVELVEFRAPARRPVAELIQVFNSCGFTIHEDIASLDRKGRIPPWQHPSIVEVEVRCNGDEVFGFEEGEWDLIQLKYLFAFLPFELVEQFAHTVAAVATKLGIPPTHEGKVVSAADLLKYFTEIRSELINETGEDAGSEGLAIFIQSTYPRR